MTETSDALRMEIKGLMLDPASNVPIVILRDEESDVFLPIWIGVFEANAIALRIEGVEPPRPMTHDLLLATLTHLGAAIERIVISDLRDSTFFARIHLDRGGTKMTLDSRPSDAIALALRADAPIFVLRAVLEKAHAVDHSHEATEEEKIRKMLEELGPEDLGKYTM